MTRSRTFLWHVVALGVLAACGGTGGTESPGPDDIEPLAQEYSVLGALAEIPSLGDDGLIIHTADLRAASEAAGLQVPADGSREAVGPWVLALSGNAAADRDPSPIFVPWARSFNVEAAAPDDFADHLGFSLLDVHSFVEVEAQPAVLTVAVGDEDLTSSSDLIELERDVVTDRDDEDFRSDVEAASPASRIGVPVRVAGEPGHLAFGTSTPLVRDWLDGGETLADDDALAGVASGLDRQGVVSAVLTPVSSGQDVRGGAAELMPEESFDAVGIGWSVSEGAPAGHVAYHFESDEAATDAVDALEAAYSGGTSVVTRQSFSEFFALDGVTAEGSVVTVSVTPETGRTAMLYRAFTARDLLFVSR